MSTVLTPGARLAQRVTLMRSKVVLQPSEEGVAASVPGLPGCWSQAADDTEALETIRSAIAEYLAVVSADTGPAAADNAAVRDDVMNFESQV